MLNAINNGNLSLNKFNKVVGGKMSFDFKILTDEVVDSDLFADKTHEKSADTLFKVIGASDKSITIGLEGAWGQVSQQ